MNTTPAPARVVFYLELFYNHIVWIFLIKKKE